MGAMHKGQTGLSLLEVLVAVVVLSLGILGVAGLMNVSLKNSHSALLRAQAAQYAYDMLDRMRVNRTQALAGNYDLPLAAGPPAGTSLADHDRIGWLNQLATLPEGDGEIRVTVDPTGNVVRARVRVQWSEAALGGGVVDYEVETEL
jgi:type IV pilus assembly protein PilV